MLEFMADTPIGAVTFHEAGLYHVLDKLCGPHVFTNEGIKNVPASTGGQLTDDTGRERRLPSTEVPAEMQGVVMYGVQFPYEMYLVAPLWGNRFADLGEPELPFPESTPEVRAVAKGFLQTLIVPSGDVVFVFPLGRLPKREAVCAGVHKVLVRPVRLVWIIGGELGSMPHHVYFREPPHGSIEDELVDTRSGDPTLINSRGRLIYTESTKGERLELGDVFRSIEAHEVHLRAALPNSELEHLLRGFPLPSHTRREPALKFLERRPLEVHVGVTDDSPGGTWVVDAVIETGPHKAAGLAFAEARTKEISLGPALYKLSLDRVGVKLDFKFVGVVFSHASPVRHSATCPRLVYIIPRNCFL